MANETYRVDVNGGAGSERDGDAAQGGRRAAEKKIFVVTSGKGGVGKTTTTANLGTALALRGRKVVVIDADIGLRNLDVIMGLENRIVFTLVDVVQGRCHYRKALIKDRRVPTLYLLPASQTDDKEAVSPAQMKALLQEMREEFDYLFIDCPAGIEQGFRNSIAGAEEALVITTPEVAAIRDADRVIGLLHAEGIGARLIINRIAPEMVRRGDMLAQQDVLDILAIELLGVVPQDEQIVVSTNTGVPVVLDGESKAAQAFRRIARRLEGEAVPLPTFEPTGFFARLGRKLRLA
ncbi:MAG TPA: septum site-determining protein MinD [Thermodesulfobacteriota bacterium]|nr:septum site-determining protein MinD [Thermodesulfobacteriota bacterium]